MANYYWFAKYNLYKEKKKNQTLSGFYCFTISNRCVTQMWYNTVLYCHMIIYCAFIASIIAFVSSKRGVDDPHFNKYVIIFSNQIFNIWKNQLAEIFKKFIRQNECSLGKRYFLNAFFEEQSFYGVKWPENTYDNEKL